MAAPLPTREALARELAHLVCPGTTFRAGEAWSRWLSAADHALARVAQPGGTPHAPDAPALVQPPDAARVALLEDVASAAERVAKTGPRTDLLLLLYDALARLVALGSGAGGDRRPDRCGGDGLAGPASGIAGCERSDRPRSGLSEQD